MENQGREEQQVPKTWWLPRSGHDPSPGAPGAAWHVRHFDARLTGGAADAGHKSHDVCKVWGIIRHLIWVTFAPAHMEAALSHGAGKRLKRCGVH